MGRIEMTPTMFNNTTTVAPPTTLTLFWQWLIITPWRIVVVIGIPSTVGLVLIATAVVCCVKARRHKVNLQADDADDADAAADSQAVDESSQDSTEVSRPKCKLLPPIPQVERSTDQDVTPLVDGDDSTNIKVDELTALKPPSRPPNPTKPTATIGTPAKTSITTTPATIKQRSFKQHGTSTNNQKAQAYIEVELNPVSKGNEGVIIATQTPTQYAQIAGFFQPFPKK